jgi:hypothetical protein
VNVPDHRPDVVRTEPVADEIALCNVIRLEKHGRLWRALVGPDHASGMQAFGDTPRRAILHLAIRCEALGWSWDDTWREPELT